MLGSAERLHGMDQPTVWSIMTPLAIQTQSVNLGQGFPTWQPPAFFTQHLQWAVSNTSHQYIREFGSIELVDAIASFHRKTFPDLDIKTNILVVNGGCEGLYSSISAFINPGDEAVIIDPSYDFYRPQVAMQGGISIGVPLTPKNKQSSVTLKARFDLKKEFTEEDEWILNFEELEAAFSQKTKIFILNSPHNPIGKVFSNEQLDRIAIILRKFPSVVVIQDNVYEGMSFDGSNLSPLPKLATRPEFASRCLSIYSAGKIFSATGIRSGWVIGSNSLMSSVRAVHQYTVSCGNPVIETTVAHSLRTISQEDNTYMRDFALKLERNRNILLEKLMQTPFDFDLWVPKGGYFVLADISRVLVKEKYLIDSQGKPRSRDYAFAYQLALENGVVCIPCSTFYSKNTQHLGCNFIRFAFCKDEGLIIEAGNRLLRVIQQ